MLRRILTIISISVVGTFASEQSEKLDNIQKNLDNIISKAGIQFSGEFKSEYVPSKIEGSAINDSTDRQVESNEFTSVDFDISARPNSMVSARTIFRLHQNWQNFFSDVANPIFSRWLSIDGNVKDMFGFHVGDFKERYTPLTLFAPEIEILNEPYIFARQREIAMDELFLGDNNRVLQGLNLKFDAEVVPLFNEFHLSLIGSRLRNIETNIQNGSKVTPPNQKNPISKYFIGGNLDMTFLKGINFGFTNLFIFDQKLSFRGSDTTADTLAQRTNIVSIRPGIDIGKIISSDVFTLSVRPEIAISIDDSTSFELIDSVRDFKSRTITGSAIDFKAVAGYSAGQAWGIDADISFISNGNNFRNELAQSPTFIGDRIFNKENSIRDSVVLYNTFDALYHSIFKFVPSRNTNRWAKSPFMATSYLRSIYTQEELGVFAARGYYDPALQLIMPLGPATPNRTGLKGKVGANVVNQAVRIDGQFSVLQEAEEIKINDSLSFPKASFTQFGGGVKVNISKVITTMVYPLEISGSYVLTSFERPALNTTIGKSEIQSGFLNLGLYYKFWKRTALMAGYQSISNTLVIDTTETEVTFGNWSMGLEWKVTDGADVVATVGQMTKENPLDIGDVQQTMADISLRVKF